MSAKTKIVVLHKKEVFYAGAFTAAGILLIILFLILFLPSPDRNTTPDPDRQLTEDPQTLQLSPTPKAVVSTELEAAPKSGILQENLPETTYRPGIYKTELILGGQSLEVEAVLEKDHISSLRLVNLDDSIATMYPLLGPTMEKICDQVYTTQSLEHLELDSSAKYTSLVLLEAIRCCLEKGME